MDPSAAAIIGRTLSTIGRFRSELDELEYQLVVQARGLGATWDYIGEEMLGGISRQVAQRRFAQQRRRYLKG